MLKSYNPFFVLKCSNTHFLCWSPKSFFLSYSPSTLYFLSSPRIPYFLSWNPQSSWGLNPRIIDFLFWSLKNLSWSLTATTILCLCWNPRISFFVENYLVVAGRHMWRPTGKGLHCDTKCDCDTAQSVNVTSSFVGGQMSHWSVVH